jgi:hypothetical protein
MYSSGNKSDLIQRLEDFDSGKTVPKGRKPKAAAAASEDDEEEDEGGDGGKAAKPKAADLFEGSDEDSEEDSEEDSDEEEEERLPQEKACAFLWDRYKEKRATVGQQKADACLQKVYGKVEEILAACYVAEPPLAAKAAWWTQQKEKLEKLIEDQTFASHTIILP